MPALTFLIVDDNELQQRVAQAQLARAGHHAMAASDPAEVEAMLAAHEAGVVLLAAALPGARAALAAALRPRSGGELPPPIVVLGVAPGADGQRELARELVARGAAGMVPRPYRERLAAQLELFAVGSAPATVLVVDDSPSQRRATVATLDTAGHVAVQAGDGKQGLACLGEHADIDMVLSDVVMPEMDGYAFCRAVRARPEWRDLPFVMLTALEDVGSQSRAIEAGADDVLQKPISAEELRARVRATLRLKMLQRKLRRRNEELAAAMQLRDDLTHMLVHDLKNPLSVMLVSGELIEADCQAAGLTQAAGFAREVMNATFRLKRFTDTLLDLARLEGGAARPHVTEFSAGEVAAEVANDMRLLGLRYGVDVVCEAPVELRASADREWTYRILQNLMDNALKHAPQSSRVVVSGVRIPAPLEGGKDLVELRVTDQGPGIPEEARVTVFDKFTQLPGGSRRGIGLGLAFCRLAVEAQGGTIEVRGAPPPASGAVFAFTLLAA